MLSYAPILWIFLSLLFFLKLACSLFFKFVPRFCILVSGMYTVLVCTCVLPHYTVIYEDVILTYVCRLLFYTYIATKHTKIITRWHRMAWYNGKIDRTFHQNGLDGKRSNSSTYDWKVRHQSHFPPPFCFFSLVVLLTPITTFRSNIVRSIIIGHTS